MSEHVKRGNNIFYCKYLQNPMESFKGELSMIYDYFQIWFLRWQHTRLFFRTAFQRNPHFIPPYYTYGSWFKFHFGANLGKAAELCAKIFKSQNTMTTAAYSALSPPCLADPADCPPSPAGSPYTSSSAAAAWPALSYPPWAAAWPAVGPCPSSLLSASGIAAPD